MKIIAELGHNHLGIKDRASVLINKALDTDVDGITMQVREDVFYEGTSMELGTMFILDAIRYIQKFDKLAGIAVCSCNQIDTYDEADFWKILAKDFHNDELVMKAIETDKPVYISCGDVELKDLDKWKEFDNVIFTHTQFSNDSEDANLKAIQTMKNYSDRPVGFGLHSGVKAVAFTAVGFEPAAIFMYIGELALTSIPDYKHSIEIQDLEFFVHTLRELEKAIGNGNKIKTERKIFNGSKTFDKKI